MSNTTILFCLVHGDDPIQHAFQVEVSETDTVSKLKQLIKAEKTPDFDDITADKLTLWSVNIPQDELTTLDPNTNVQTLGGIKLSPFSKISNAFPVKPSDEHLHIIVVRPATVTSNSDTQNITPPNSTQNNKTQGKYILIMLADDITEKIFYK
jgi:hypothetical protein